MFADASSVDMAMDESKTVSVTSNIQQAEDYDPSLDFSSELFDPLKALRTPGLIPPISDAKPYDNIAKYKTVYSDKSQTITVKAGTSKSEPTETYQRKWLPHQRKFANKRYFCFFFEAHQKVEISNGLYTA